MGLSDRLYYKAKALVKRKNIEDIISRHGLNAQEVDLVSEGILDSLDTVSNYVKDSSVLLDIGANRGLFTKAANAFHPFKQSICFEPNPQMHAKLNANCTGFNFKLEDLALADKKGELEFFLHGDSSMNSLVESDNDVLIEEFPYDDPEDMVATKVQTNTLDAYIKESGLADETFFIKIDTQGNEFDVLSNGIETLKRTEIVLMEYMFVSPYKINFSFLDMIQFMNDNGFVSQGALGIFKRPSKKISGVDFLFVNQRLIDGDS